MAFNKAFRLFEAKEKSTAFKGPITNGQNTCIHKGKKKHILYSKTKNPIIRAHERHVVPFYTARNEEL